MSYIVLGLGMLVSAIGAYAMYSGFRIIEIERGWATAIVGSVLFTGGFVTIMVGLAVRALEKLRDILQAQPPPSVAAAAPATLAPPPEAETTPVSTAWDRTIVPAAAPETAVEPLRETGEEAAPRSGNRIPAPAMAADIPEPREHEPEKPADPAPPAATEPTLEPEEPELFTAPDTLDWDEPARPRDPTAPIEPVVDPAMDTWLDDSFAELDEPDPVTHPVREPDDAADTVLADTNRHETATETKSEAPLAAAGEVDEPSPQRADAHPASPAREAPQSAVIGRYESEGTSYVMYADGSIEAQSEAGVYRFASMAELKAFIEG